MLSDSSQLRVLAVAGRPGRKLTPGTVRYVELLSLGWLVAAVVGDDFILCRVSLSLSLAFTSLS